MKRMLSLFVLTFLMLNPLLSAGGMSDHPYFKSVTGKWVGEGDLTTADGQTIHVKEVWEGKMVEGGTFVIEGDREWGDEKQVYKWVFSHNPTSDLYECEYTVTGMEKTIRFEVSVTDLATTLKSPFGEPGGEINITNTIVGKTLEGVVSVTSGSDINVLKGTIIHEKSKD